jgi:hypothetical protein
MAALGETPGGIWNPAWDAERGGAAEAKAAPGAGGSCGAGGVGTRWEAAGC